MFIFYYKYIFLIKIKIICIFLKFPGISKKNIIHILSYTKIYNLNYTYRYNYKKNVNDDKSKFQNISYLNNVKIP